MQTHIQQVEAHNASTNRVYVLYMHPCTHVLMYVTEHILYVLSSHTSNARKKAKGKM